MKERLQKLASKLKTLNLKIANEVDDLADSIETSTSKTPLVKDIKDKVDSVSDLGSLNSSMIAIMSYIRAMHMWFHGAHHVVGGESFAGDHTSLYGRIYEEIQDDFDGTAEKAIGLSEIDVACPIVIAQGAAKILSKFKSPCDLSAEEISEEGLSIIKEFLSVLDKIYNSLKEKDLLTLGLDDFIMGMSNDYETFIY